MNARDADPAEHVCTNCYWEENGTCRYLNGMELPIMGVEGGLKCFAFRKKWVLS